MYRRGTVHLFVGMMLGLLDIVGGRRAEDEIVSEVAADACCFGRDCRGRDGKQRSAKAQKHFHARFRPSNNPSLRCSGAGVVAFPPHLGQIDCDRVPRRNKQASNAVHGLPFPASE
jgi:hypothetical protein